MKTESTIKPEKYKIEEREKRQSSRFIFYQYRRKNER